MRRFHLLSFMAALLTASVLVGVNALVYTQYIDSYTPTTNESDYLLIANRTYGWPFSAIEDSGHVIPAAVFERRSDEPGFAKLKAGMNQSPSRSTRLGDQTYTRIPEGVITLYHLEFNGWAIILNTAVLLACSAAALFLCEHLARRRDARTKLKART